MNKILLFITLIIFTTAIYPQKSKEALQREKKRLEDDIKYINRLLEETRRSASVNLNQLNLLNEQLINQNRLLAVIQSELNLLNEEIKNIQESIKTLEKDITLLKEEYAKMIYYSYITRNTYSRLMFIFASKTFNEAYLRLRYLQEYSMARKRQVENIREKQTDLANKLNEIKQKQKQKFELLKQQEEKANELNLKKQEKDKLVQNLRTKERTLLAEVKQKQEEINRIKAEIENLIKKEIEEANRRKDVKKVEGKTIALTTEELETAKGFASNKGRLPWPVDNGVVLVPFGEIPHPILPGIKIKSNGVDISTEQGSKVKAVFDGTVTAIFTLPNGTKAIIIRHGDYLTVYGNLQNVLVSKNDKIKLGQVLGTVNTDSENSTILHFEVWREKNLEDPEQWLRQRQVVN